MSGRWSFYLAIEGHSTFGKPIEDVLEAQNQLMQAIFRVGRYCYPQHPDQLFVLQCGDGFLVASEFHEESLERCATIAVAVMQHIASGGRWCRGAITEGELSDIQDSYPQEVRDCFVEDHTYSMHMGLMTTSPVMGTALTQALALDRIGPQGPLLFIRQPMTPRLGAAVPVVEMKACGLTSIDWVHMRTPLLSELRRKATLEWQDAEVLESQLDNYCRTHAVPEDWARNVHQLLHIPSAHHQATD
ncbi:hypothetical protein [Marinobacterium rhizophilum]|uniref:hypothetical protein n=1 Tax=Marinobacterium rhizophilum TaxID=420402 RepID=UPI00037A1FA1|nr:hypothetical protein [Marinobacterium rhizophilum]